MFRSFWPTWFAPLWHIEMSGRAFPPDVDGLHGAAGASEIAASAPFVAIDDDAPADRAHNPDGTTAAAGLTPGQGRQRQAVSWLAKPIRHLFTLATILFFVVSPDVFNLVGWHYAGGGGEYEKIHIATYLLVVAFISLWLIDPRFRGDVTYLCGTDWTLISFVLAVGATAFYAVLVKHVSIAPFVDTFLAALLVTIGWICLPSENLRRLRRLVDIYFIVNIAILFLEYATKSPLIGADTTDSFEFGQFRAHALFENTLSAANLLGVYSIANFVSMPIKLTRTCLIRLTLGFTSLFAILTTGARTAMVVTILILLVFLAFSAARQIASGRINRAAVVYGSFGVPVLAIIMVLMLQFGIFDTMASRFEYDIGSAHTRQIAIDLVSNLPTIDLWFGLSQSDLDSLLQVQAELKLVAIEISWVNFILTCGLVFTLPLFVTYALFLLRFLPRYCVAPAILPCVFLLVVTASSNSIFAKTTVLTTSFVIILAFFRKSSLSRTAVSTARTHSSA